MSDPAPSHPAPGDPTPPGPAAPLPGPAGRQLDPLLLVVAATAVGIGVAATRHPAAGTWICCGALALGAALRLVLSTRAAGSLVVRRRHVDVAVMTGLATALGVLAAVTPFRSHGG